ncbi:GntR family transcriptional regulator [Neoroseomonas marina]|nr:GntR family transcriptional regulator [Neoroseomonas marina]
MKYIFTMDAAPATAVEAATHRLREEIVAGALPPEARLRLRDLAARTGYGATPLREALSRLAAEGFVVFEGQKGFSVPPVTRAHLLDITRSRQFVEPEALRLAMEAGGAAWEDEIVASLSLLKREVERRTQEESWLDVYEAKHHRFHRALIAACPLVSLRAFCDELYMQTTRYRRLMKSVTPDWQRMAAAHQALADLVLARDAAAQQALRDHIGTTASRVLAMFGDADPP